MTFDDEMFDFIVDAYELEPASGRRLISRGVLSMPKGRAKSEVAGLIGVAAVALISSKPSLPATNRT
ncbi:hypothetical protein [Priestia sp. TGN 0903]|uniref:hypothetical protein n=1 Tax=Priestia sp. TGN 0903 TaxID=3420730 RepID=UPI003D781970